MVCLIVLSFGAVVVNRREGCLPWHAQLSTDLARAKFGDKSALFRLHAAASRTARGVLCGESPNPDFHDPEILNDKIANDGYSQHSGTFRGVKSQDRYE